MGLEEDRAAFVLQRSTDRRGSGVGLPKFLVFVDHHPIELHRHPWPGGALPVPVKLR